MSLPPNYIHNVLDRGKTRLTISLPSNYIHNVLDRKLNIHHLFNTCTCTRFYPDINVHYTYSYKYKIINEFERDKHLKWLDAMVWTQC